MKMHASRMKSEHWPAILIMVGSLFVASAMAGVVEPPATEDPVVEEPDTTAQDTTAQDTTAQDTTAEDPVTEDPVVEDPIVEPIPEPVPEPITEPEVDWNATDIKINFGNNEDVEGFVKGEFFTSENGMNFHFFGGSVEATGLPNELDPDIYQYVRHRGESKDPLYMIFPKVPDGSYLIRFHTVDAYGGRAIDIWVEGDKVIEDLDPITEAGGEWKPVIKEVVVQVSGGLDIMLDDDREDAKDVFLSAIEIIRGGSISIGVREPFARRVRSNIPAGFSMRRHVDGISLSFGGEHRFSVMDAAGRHIIGSRHTGGRTYTIARRTLRPGLYLLKAVVTGEKVSRILLVK